MPLAPESIVSYLDILKEEGVATLQRGMNYRFKPSYSVILMSVRPGAPYSDEVKKGEPINRNLPDPAEGHKTDGYLGNTTA